MPNVIWYLEESVGKNRISSIPIEPLPFLIGRHNDCHLKLNTEGTSRRHAEMYLDGGRLYIRDLKSSNGTYVNRRKVYDEVSLYHKDIIHIANKEYRLVCQDIVAHQQTIPLSNADQTLFASVELEQTPVSYVEHINSIIDSKKLVAVFQPIVDAHSHEIVAYEGLGRGVHDKLPPSPGALFSMAENVGKAVELSEVLQSVVSSSFRVKDRQSLLFINTHHQEQELDRIVSNFKILQRDNPQILFVLEINEQAVCDLDFMFELRKALNEINVKLAYDDFGAGQGRLLELMKVPPDYLKFDITLVRDIHKQTEQSRYIVQTLVEMAKKLNIVTLAEGVECKEAADICRDIGFDLIQGYYFGKPEVLL